MSSPLLATKLYTPPVRPELVVRPRLTGRLQAGLLQAVQQPGQGFARALTLVSAPAGYGKTTLVSAWLRDTGLPVAWLSLDEGDNDIRGFFGYLLAALQRVDPGLGQSIQPELERPQLPPLESLVTGLINDIVAASEPFVLVLDDLHSISDLAVHEAIGLLVERLPPHLHLVIVTRHDPPLPLPRLRARGQLVEVRQQDLRFTQPEAVTLLNQSFGLELKASQAATLQARTEGWAAGLQMAGLSMQGRDVEDIDRFITAFSGRHHYILDYLTDEVLGRQPESVQTFLLQTSVLARLCGPLCDAVQGAAPPVRGQQMLEALHRDNLFILPLDDERQWYRYHHLFAVLLRARLLETEPELVPELHRRAASWHEEKGLAIAAVEHALATEDATFAAGVVERAVTSMDTWGGTDVATLCRWLEALPEELLRTRYWLRLFASRALAASGHLAQAEKMLLELESALQEDATGPEVTRLLGLVAADRASYAAVRGEVLPVIEFARRALAHLPEEEPIGLMRVHAILGLAHFRGGEVREAERAFSQTIAIATASGNNFAAAPIACNLAEARLAQGRLREAWQACEHARELGTLDGTLVPAAGFAGLEMGKLLYEWNDLDAAERHAREGIEALERGGIAGSFGTGHAVLAQILRARGDDSGALDASEEAVRAAAESGVPRLEGLAAAYQAQIWLALGHLDQASAWAEDYRQVGATEHLRIVEDLALARVLLARDQLEETRALLDSLLPPAETQGRWGHAIEVLILRALALDALGDTATALENLDRALALGEPEGYIRLFVDEGRPLAALLRQAAGRGPAASYARKLLSAIAASKPPAGDDAAPSPEAPVQPLIEPLTARELEVLQLLAEGLSNREIAQRLVVSLPTVKSHTRNIYGKLSVHSRRQAVAHARDLGILV
jgi:LuxR family maltose regulon positive regulatory protein